MLKNRIIPCLDVKNGRVVKGINFIDLNSIEATKSSLDYFYERLNKGGIILFDDYGGFEDTRAIVDQFFRDKYGHFINLPTGQGIFVNA